MRAFRASVVGILVFPPLVTFYSMFPILSMNLSEVIRDRALRGWLIASISINAVVLVGVIEFARSWVMG